MSAVEAVARLNYSPRLAICGIHRDNAFGIWEVHFGSRVFDFRLGSQRVIELQESALEPNVRASLDFRGRYQLAQFRVANRGGSAAFDVAIEWENQLKTLEGRPVQIFDPSGTLPVLLPGDEASFLLGQSNDFLNEYSQTTWSGIIRYRNAATERREVPVSLTAEHERLSLVHDKEEPKTHYELQRVPDCLEQIADELSKLRELLENRK